jgi:hypothetical protein
MLPRLHRTQKHIVRFLWANQKSAFCRVEFIFEQYPLFKKFFDACLTFLLFGFFW